LYNFGHGQQHVVSMLLSLMVLAYFLHTMLQRLDARFALLRKIVPSRKVLFNDLRSLTSYLCFESWSALVEFMIDG
jgi:hypothetical protein